MNKFRSLTRKEVEEKLALVNLEDQVKIYNDMKILKERHLQEQSYSGWSNQYIELLSKQNTTIQKYLGNIDSFTKETLWKILSDKFYQKQGC